MDIFSNVILSKNKLKINFKGTFKMKRIFSFNKKSRKIASGSPETINIIPKETSEKHFQNKQILTKASQKNTSTLPTKKFIKPRRDTPPTKLFLSNT